MSTQGRSLDDLPLAAYTTGMRADERLEELDELEADAVATDDLDAVAASAATNAAMAADVSEAAATGLPTDPEGLGAPQKVVAPRRMPGVPAIPAMPEWLANPRAHTRDPRLLMTGVIGVGVVVLVASLALGGGSPAGAAGPAASASARPVVVATAAPLTGDATVEVTGKLKGDFTLTGAAGTGPASDGRIAVTWADATGSSLAMAGPASSGTRTTDATFSLTWTTLVDGAPMAFTSSTGECTVGMALQPKTVTGSFVCKKLRSSDGKVTIDVRGTYRT
jgi:hypothetical protein